MKISEAFPSKYLKHADLQGREVKKKIAYVQKEQVGLNGEEKPVLHFVGEQRGLVLNKTNSNTMSCAYGDDTEAWRGREITLFPTRVDFKGRPTDTIRVRVTKNGSGALPDDDIPFAPEWRG
jgi:hypothetical protein